MIKTKEELFALLEQSHVECSYIDGDDEDNGGGCGSGCGCG